jgi:SSS family solute:Na+ symporter
MTAEINWLSLGVFVSFFALVTVMGFYAARWKRAAAPAHLDEWGLGGRQFGTWIT